MTAFTDKQHRNQSWKGRVRVCFHIKRKEKKTKRLRGGDDEAATKQSVTRACEAS